MADRGSKRPGSMSDEDRALAAANVRRRLRRVPEHIDPEKTPPPRINYDSIPPPIAEAFKSLESGLERLWDNRDDGHRLDRLESKIEAYTQTSARNAEAIEQWLIPFARSAPGRFEELSLSVADVSSSVRSLATSVSTMVDRVERKVEFIDGRVVELEDVTRDHTAKISALENHQLHPRLSTIENELLVKQAGDAREMALVRRRSRRLAAFWGAIVAAAGTIASLIAGSCT